MSRNILRLALVISTVVGIVFWAATHRPILGDAAAALIPRFMSGVLMKVRARQALQDESQFQPAHEGRRVNRVLGYADRHSVAAGQSFSLMLGHESGPAPIFGRVVASRVGADGLQEVWRGEPLQVKPERRSATASVVGAAWRATITLTVPSGWRSGYYTFDFVADDGRVDSHVAHIVVVNLKRSGDVLVKLGTNTYQGYNRWGGLSLYDEWGVAERGDMVSFDRPTPPDFFLWDAYLVRWLEALALLHNFTVDYATDFDLHIDPSIAYPYPLMIVSGHDEYWTPREFSGVWNRIYRLGRNTAFFGGNIGYHCARYADVNSAAGDRGRQLVFFKGGRDPFLAPSAPSGTKAQDLACRVDVFDTGHLYGLEYSGWLNPRIVTKSDLAVRAVNHAALPFQSGRLNDGESAGLLLGYEWDRQRSAGNASALTPEGGAAMVRIIPIFEGQATDKGGELRPYQAVYFKAPSGAEVFAAGTINWNWGLGKTGYTSDRFRDFNKAMVLHLMSRPASSP